MISEQKETLSQSANQSIAHPINKSTQLAMPIRSSSNKRKHGCILKSSPFHIAPANLASHSPSLIDGISFKEETLLRAETADFISQMGQICKVSQWTIATAAVYMHAFFSHLSFGRFDRFEVAATCLFLAGKVEERRIRVDQVIHAYYSVRLNHVSNSKKPNPSSNQTVKQAAHFGLNMPHHTSEEWEAFRQRIYALEYSLMDTAEFDFELTHPYQNLMTFLRDVIFGPNFANMPANLLKKEMDEKGGLAQIAWLFINDSFRSTLCLRYPPDVICVGVISLAIKFRKFDEPRPFGQSSQKPHKRWYEELFGLDLAAIVDIEKTVSESANQSYVPDLASAEQLVRAHNLSPVPSLPMPRVTRPAGSVAQSSLNQSNTQNSSKKWHPRASKRRSLSSVAKIAVNVQPVNHMVTHLMQPVGHLVNRPIDHPYHHAVPQVNQSLSDAAGDCAEWDAELMPAAPTRTASPVSPSPNLVANMSPLSPSTGKHGEQRSPNSAQSRKRACSPYQQPLDHSVNPSVDLNMQLVDEYESGSFFQTSQTKVAVSLAPRFNLAGAHASSPIGQLNHVVNSSINSSIEPTECSDWEDEDEVVRPPVRAPHRYDMDDSLEHLMKHSEILASQSISSSTNPPMNPRLYASLTHIHAQLALQMRSSFPVGQCSDRARLNKRQRFDDTSSSPVTFC